jgi:hypothetical protein
VTKQQIMAAIVECEEKLGRSPSFIELATMTGVTRKQVRWHFGDYRKALKACGLEGMHGGGGSKLDMERLFKDWARVVRELKRVPTTPEYLKLGKYSQTPLMMRFGVWANVPEGMKVFVQQQGLTEEWKDVLEIIEEHKGSRGKNAWPPAGMKSPDERVQTQEPDDAGGVGAQGPGDTAESKGREMYGGLMRPGPMVCAPTNEQGVLFLFGAMAESLGFAVLKIGTAYPDCEAFRVVEGGRLERVKIEFELDSRNFLRHMHDASKSDMIVCWRHNWAECPLEVIALSEWQNLPRKHGDTENSKRSGDRA